MARPGQRRIQGALFAFLTVFFAGVAWTAYRATPDRPEFWVIALAAGVLTLWMGAMTIRTFHAAREEMTR